MCVRNHETLIKVGVFLFVFARFLLVFCFVLVIIYALFYCCVCSVCVFSCGGVCYEWVGFGEYSSPSFGGG